MLGKGKQRGGGGLAGRPPSVSERRDGFLAPSAMLRGRSPHQIKSLQQVLGRVSLRG